MNIGIDIVFLPKLAQALKSTPDLRSKILHLNERANGDSIEFLGGRFAAKEAILKCGLENFSILKFDQIELGSLRKPYSEFLFEGDFFSVNLSISHDLDYAIAIALNLQKSIS